ncbi:hypothetical protein PRN20_05905 [Devosia sp. ZB163]|uniref:hypothetical protein n=1 Tax=Devosia sp. ZB163 TaxID=3025938 RepID=UPI0023603D27|nr:hypothetical protein [Devosia sp. ZB163]MDC9823259.1 hypothetical protein [Devosia sp. ZB163]
MSVAVPAKSGSISRPTNATGAIVNSLAIFGITAAVLFGFATILAGSVQAADACLDVDAIAWCVSAPWPKQ